MSGRRWSGRWEGEGELESPERLAQIPEGEIALLRRFAETLAGLRARRTRLPLAELIDRGDRDRL